MSTQTPSAINPRLLQAGPLLQAFWFAMVTGFAVFAVFLAGKYVLGQVLYLDPHLLWKGVVANTVLFTAVVLVLLTAGKAWPPLRHPAATTGALATLATLSVLLLVPRVHLVAKLALSAGIGLQLGSLLARKRLPRGPFAANTLFAGLVVTALSGTAVRMYEWNAERRAATGVPAANPGAPNIILLIWDTVRAASLSVYGYERPTTPTLDSLASRSIVYDRAFVPAPWTLASHASIFTGHWPFEVSATWTDPLDDAEPVIAEVLRDNGWLTAGFMANHTFGPPSWGLARGFVHYEYYPRNLAMMLDAAPVIHLATNLCNRWFDRHYNPRHRRAREVTSAFLKWQANNEGRPFFAFLNLFDAHEPYNPPAPWSSMFGNPAERAISNDAAPTPELARELQDAYDGAIAYLDEQLRLLMAELAKRGVLENTWIVVSSDHGELFGEHGLIDHGNSLYAPLLHVPLIVVPPRAQAPARVRAPISTRNLPATLATLAGVPPTAFPGRPVLPLADSDSTAQTDPGARPAEPILAVVPFAPRQPPWYPLAKGDMRSVILWPHQYIQDGEGREEVFDLERDPSGLTDIAGVDSVTLARLRAVADSLIGPGAGRRPGAVTAGTR